MFQAFTKKYIQEEAPATVIPHCMSVPAVKQNFNLETVYKLASNENPFGVSSKAAAAIQNAIADCHIYSDGSRENVLCDKLAMLHGVKSSNIFIAGGAASVLSQIADTFLVPGDECIIPSPAYPPYYFWAFRNYASIVDVPCVDATQTVDLDGILSSVSSKTKLLFLCNPNNPTSTAVPRQELEALLYKLPETVIAVADEAYVDFADDPDSLTLIPSLEKFLNLIVVHTFSKLYGMASVRLGYSVACEELTEYLTRGVACRGLNTFGVEGGIAALDDDAFRQQTLLNNRNERLYLTQALTSLGFKVYHSQSNFIWVDFGRPASEVHDDLLPYGIIIRGDFPFARISIGQPFQNRALVEALEKIAAQH